MTGCCPLCGSELVSDDLVLLPELLTVCRGKLRARLTVKEWEIFQHLYAVSPRVLRHEALLDWVYQLENDQPSVKIISVFVHKIRPKIKPLGMEIVNHFAIGYGLKFEGTSRVVKEAAAA